MRCGQMVINIEKSTGRIVAFTSARRYKAAVFATPSGRFGVLSGHATQSVERLNVQNVIHFGTGKEGNGVLGAGWGVPEDGFVWTEGPFSSVNLPISEKFSTVSFSLWGYVPKGGVAQSLLVFANGVMIGMSEVAGKAILKLSLKNVPISGGLSLQFSVPNARSPKEAEGVADDRRLGIALAALVLA